MGINEKAWSVGFKWTIGNEDVPAPALAIDNYSKQLHVCDIADVGKDWDVGVVVDPTLYIHCFDTNAATDYIKMWHDDTDANIQAYNATQITLGIDGTEYATLSTTYFTLNDIDIQLGDNDYICFGDATGGDVSLRWNTSLLQMLPATDDTGYLAIGNGAADMDVRIYLGTSAKYALFDVGDSYFYLEDVDMKLGDNDYIRFGDGTNGGDVTIRWDGSLLQWLPITDDTGYMAIGNGATDMDLRIYLGTPAKYALFDVGDSYFYLEDVDMRLGDNDFIRFGDGTNGGDVSVKWDGNLLQFLPAVDDTGYVAIGNGTLNMDFRVYGSAPANYVECDVGNDYFSLVNTKLYAPNLDTSAGQAGIIYVATGSDNILRLSQ